MLAAPGISAWFLIKTEEEAGLTPAAIWTSSWNVTLFCGQRVTTKDGVQITRYVRMLERKVWWPRCGGNEPRDRETAAETP